MGVLKRTADRLEKFDQGIVAARDSFNSQAALNVALTVGVGVALLIAVVALARSTRD